MSLPKKTDTIAKLDKFWLKEKETLGVDGATVSSSTDAAGAGHCQGPGGNIQLSEHTDEQGRGGEDRYLLYSSRSSELKGTSHRDGDPHQPHGG